ncbi:hypothetical protein Ddye_019025 [Dipteronia dyeriana]|uniref:Uncharacterized protein n=1 Tax=Dipteronia dyeriana TaxID=168575 RepID=A0AAD9WVL5_9ROSI|nr:hypothetical protein Ddye_019025 [Dipteronia dyeriana]
MTSSIWSNHTQQIEEILFSKVGTDKIYAEICKVIGFKGLDAIKNLFEEYRGVISTRDAICERLKNYAYTYFGAGDIARAMLIFDTNIDNRNLRSEELGRICVDIRNATQCNDIVMQVIQTPKNNKMTYLEGAAQLRQSFEILNSDPLET